MTKDSRRASIAGLPAPLPQDKSPEGGSSGIGTPLAMDEANAVASEGVQNEQPIESQSATPSNSTEVNGQNSGFATYGTRSRNRTGAARINYAEDKEIDVDLEAAASKENGARKHARNIDSTSMTDSTQSTTNSRRAGTNDPELGNENLQNGHQDTASALSSANNNAATSQPAAKKRKLTSQQATTSSTVSQSQSVSNIPIVSQASSSKSFPAAQLVPGFRETNMLGFERSRGQLKNKVLIADDGTKLQVNDHVYLICEPPGEPYYLGRIMEFLHANNDPKQPIDALRLNWYYRPKDIGRQVSDTRQVFASMHSDISPLTALRGKCTIKHKSEIAKLDDFRRSKDSFWYEKLYDRYIHRYYDVVPTVQVINVPVEVKKVLDERWRYIIVEPGRGKELTSAVKLCKRCSKYCASNDSVDCAVCQNTYHMSCVSPPLLKKPSRGFAWACGPCSKAQEKKLEARNTPIAPEASADADDDVNEDEDSHDAATASAASGDASPKSQHDLQVAYNPGTAEQIHQASLWLFRYLGQYCKVEDALDYDDRIYPRASSRLGPRHQAVVPPWYGQPVEYVKPVEIKKKFLKGGPNKKDAKMSKETIAALEADKLAKETRPKWIQDEPPGYTVRGEDYDNDDDRNTSKLLYKHPEEHDIPGTEPGSGLDELERDQIVFGFMSRAAQQAQSLGLPKFSTNLLDVALETLHSHNFDADAAIQALTELDKKVFKEPDPTPTELKKFEDGVSKFGSEWYNIRKHVKTMKPKDVVRFYYTWKKTPRGAQVWGKYHGRKHKTQSKRDTTVTKLQDDVADEHDDSAFDNDKAFARRRGFQCKFCDTRSSRQWRRAPNTPAGTMIAENPALKTTGKDKGPQLMVALCRRCAELWRRYGIQWEDIEEVKKNAQVNGKASKRKIDEELLNELLAANEVVNHPPSAAFAPVSAGGTPAPVPGPQHVEPSKKKGKISADVIASEVTSEIAAIPKKVVVPEKPPPPPVPEMPKPKTLPCAICHELEPLAEQHLTCKECRLSVHRNCYGVVGESRVTGKWICDMCSNDKNPQVSVQYKCMLCPVEHTEHDFVEAPKMTTKKKTEKDRERERLEKETNIKAAEFYRKRQEEMNRPVNPREPLKRTANNNWVHVTCAVFTPEVKFGNARALAPSEGIPSIAAERYEETCKACKRKGGACIGCHTCRAPVHVECAHQAGYLLGFDITPVKGSRRDQSNVVRINGESGIMTAAVWCKEHVPTKSIVHHMQDIVDETGLNALQLYVKTSKQADLALAGTVRKATLIYQSTKALPSAVGTQPVPNRRVSTTNLNGSSSLAHIGNKTEEPKKDASDTESDEKVCATCKSQVTPRWWPFPPVDDEASKESGNVESTVMSSERDGLKPDTEKPSGDILRHDLPLSTNRLPINGTPISEGSAATSVALAAAALHQDPSRAVDGPVEFQCHKCHWRKVKKEPTPVPVPSPPRAPEPSHPSISHPGSSNTPLDKYTAEGGLPEVPAHYAWPHPQTYNSNPSITWHRPSSGAHTIMNGTHSPHTHYGQVDNNHGLQHYPPSVNGQSHMRPSIPARSHSPHQQLHHLPNGFPPSPRRTVSNAPLVNGTYSTYAPPPRPSSQHLANGIHSPHLADRPFSTDYSSANRPRGPSFGTPTSPSLTRDPYYPNREMSPRVAHPTARPLQAEYPPLNLPRVSPSFGAPLASPSLPLDPRLQPPQPPPSNGTSASERPPEGRVNGGASASPSVRNLLS